MLHLQDEELTVISYSQNHEPVILTKFAIFLLCEIAKKSQFIVK